MNPKDNDDKEIADIAERTAQSIKIIDVATHAAGLVAPRSVKVAEELCKVVKEAVLDPSSSSKVEKLICASASETAKVIISTPFATAAAAATAPTGPGAVLAGAAVGTIVSHAAKPVGDVIQKMCHKVFEGLKGPEKGNVCVASALNQIMQNMPLETSMTTIRTSRTAAEQIITPIAQSFIIPHESESTRSITPLLATMIGANAGTAFLKLGMNESIKASLTADCKSATTTSPFGKDIADMLTRETDQCIANSTYLSKWAAHTAREFYKDVEAKINAHGKANAEPLFDDAIKAFATTQIKKFADQGIPVDDLLIFGRAIQKSLADEWWPTLDKKIPTKKLNASITAQDVVGDLKRIKTQLDDADLHHHIRESINMTNDSNEDTNKLLMHLLTNTNINGFERHKKIVALKSELDKIKQSPSSSPLKIFQAAQALHIEKAKVSEQEKRKEEYIQNAHHCVDIASNAAFLLGNTKLAGQISVVGGAMVNVGAVIASIGTMNPYLAASTLVGACASIKSLFGHKKKGHDGNAVILNALQAFGEQLQIFLQKNFETIMSALDDMNQNVVRGFLTLDWKANTIIEQIQALQVEINHLAERQGNMGATMMEQLTDVQKSLEDKSQRDETTKITTLIERAKRETNLKAKYTDYVTEIEAFALGPNVAAKHVHIVGSDGVSKEKDALSLVRDNHLQHKKGYAAFNTLLAYLESFNFDNDYYYQRENFDYLIKCMIEDHEDVASAPTIGLSNLLINEKEQKDESGTHVSSLLTTLKELEKTDAAIQIIPIESHGTWHLLVVDTKHETFHYYGRADQLTLNRLDAAIKNLTGYEHWRMQAPHVTYLKKEFNPAATSLLVLKQCSELATKEKTFSSVSLTITQKNAIASHRANKELLKADGRYPQTHTIPAHPVIFQYLWHALDCLVTKQYSDQDSAALLADEIAQFQRFVDEAEHIQCQLQRLKNPEFIRILITNYQEAAKTLSKEIDRERVKFEEKTSKKISTDAKLALSDDLFDTSDLKQQDIPVLTDYATIEHHHKWFYTTAMEMNDWKGPTGVNSGRGLRDPYGEDIRQEYKSAYKAARVNDIQAKKNNFISQQTKNKFKESYNYKMDLYLNSTCSKHLPVILIPRRENDPFLPMSSSSICSMVPATYNFAQMTGLGRIKFAYKIVGDQFKISAHFIEDESKPDVSNKISSISIPYDPSFYKGPEAIWWWWVGGNYCDSLQNTSLVSIPWTRYAGGYCGHVHMYKSIQVPVCAEHKGLYTQIDRHLKHVTFNDTLEPIIEQKWYDLMNDIRGEWHAELRRIIASDGFSPLGRAVRNFNACATLLSLVSEITLSSKGQDDVFTRFINEHPEFVFNQQGLDTFLRTSTENLATSIVPNELTTELLENALTHLKNNRWNSNFPLFDASRIMVSLLQCIDEYVPNMRKGLSVSKISALQGQILEMDNYVVSAACNYVKTLKMANEAEELKRDAMVAELEQYRRTQSAMRAHITSSAPNVSAIENLSEVPSLTGYQQHGLLRNQEPAAKVPAAKVKRTTSVEKRN